MCAGLAIDQLLFTHIGHEMDEWLIKNKKNLPDYVSIARDGMKILK